VPPDLDAVLLRMLAKNPDARYPSMAAIIDALAPWTREPIDPPPAMEMPRWSPMARVPAPAESPAITTSELPVVPRTGLTPVQVRVPDKARVVAAVTPPASPSAYRSTTEKQLRPLVFPNVPPSARPSDKLSNTPTPLKTGTAPTLPVAPAAPPTPAPATAKPPAPVAKPAPQGWLRFAAVAAGLVLALSIGLVLGLVVSRLRF
jgi:hypothetical protein